MLKRLLFPALFISLFLTQITFLPAQVVINEFSAANYDGIQAASGGYEDWVELYNAGSTPYDLSGHYLSDRMTNPTKWEFPAGTTIAPGEHLLIWCSKLDGNISGQLHTSFKLTQTKATEAIVFADPGGVILDSHDIDIPNQMEDSRGRTTDGAATWSVFTDWTPGYANNSPKNE